MLFDITSTVSPFNFAFLVIWSYTKDGDPLIISSFNLVNSLKTEINVSLLSSIINKELNWLLKTDSENENYFRLNKDSFQQGELIKISGTQPFDDSNFKNSISFNIIKDNNKIYNGNLEYNYEKNRWEGDFRASSPGSYLFELFIDYYMTESLQIYEIT